MKDVTHKFTWKLLQNSRKCLKRHFAENAWFILRSHTNTILKDVKVVTLKFIKLQKTTTLKDCFTKNHKNLSSPGNCYKTVGVFATRRKLKTPSMWSHLTLTRNILVSRQTILKMLYLSSLSYGYLNHTSVKST